MTMQRPDLEHLIRATATLTDKLEVVIISDQSILGTYPKVPAALLTSMVAEIYPRPFNQHDTELINSIGEGSLFQQYFGYCARGVSPSSATLPEGWEDRLVLIQVGTVRGYCLEPHDLAASKLAAGREKDIAFINEMLRLQLINRTALQERVVTLPIATMMGTPKLLCFELKTNPRQDA